MSADATHKAYCDKELSESRVKKEAKFAEIFSKNLAEITATEENAAVTHKRVSKENEIEKAKKEKDVEYKNKEAEGLDRSLTELSSDKEGVQSEHDAIHSYLGELEKECVAVPETYAERKAHRAAEIA